MRPYGRLSSATLLLTFPGIFLIIEKEFHPRPFARGEEAYMCQKCEKFYITTPIYYPSAKLHIGHTYCTVATDAMARYKRLRGCDVMFLTGTDEHGMKIEEKAREAGVSPQAFVDGIVLGEGGVKDLWKLMNISYDRFIRTTDDYHVTAIQRIFRRMYDNGDIYKGAYKGMYCTPCESFWTESQLVDGKCPDCGREVHWAEEEAYFFRLSKYADRIQDLLENTDFLQPRSRVNEMVNNFIKPGLEDLCVSRTSFTWGIPVDFDPGHVVYVWVDALSNYITALGFENDRYDDYEHYWPADYHFVGKEIVRFHTIIWPAMLMSMGEPLPKHVFGHGWLLLDGGKMSKSKGNVVDPYLLAQRYGVDALRYFLMRSFPFGSDGNFSNELLISTINTDLANDLGNLVSRTCAMIQRFFGGKLPAEQLEDPAKDAEIIALAGSLHERYEAQMEVLSFQNALAEVFKVISRANKYIDENEPWKLAKDPEAAPRLARVMYNLLETIRICAGLLTPVMPDTVKKINRRIGVEPHEKPIHEQIMDLITEREKPIHEQIMDLITDPLDNVDQSMTNLSDWDSLCVYGLLPADAEVVQGAPLFPRIDLEKELDELEAIRVAAMKEALPEKEFEPIAEDIPFDTFCACDLRAVKVLTCERVKKSDKLLKFTLDDGTGVERQILSGIAKYYDPEDLVGKTLLAIVNLPPRKMMGRESNGMLISSIHKEKGEEVIHLIVLDDKIPAGAKMC
jgi:methionyl-tRNA synthetase